MKCVAGWMWYAINKNPKDQFLVGPHSNHYHHHNVNLMTDLLLFDTLIDRILINLG